MKKKKYISSAVWLMATMVLVSAFLCTALSVAAPYWAKRLLKTETLHRLETYSDLILNNMWEIDPSDDTGKEALNALLPPEAGLRVLVTDANMLVLYDSGSQQNKEGTLLLTEPVQRALSGGTGYRFTYENGIFFAVLTSPLSQTAGRNSGAVCLLLSDRVLGQTYQQMCQAMLYIALALAAVPLLLGVLIFRFQNRNMRKLLSGVRTFKDGDWNARIPIDSHNEYGRLADDLNQLCADLANTDEMRRRFVSDASHELKTPMATIRLLSESIVQNPNIRKEDLLEFLQDIINEIDRLSRISGRMLSLARFDDPGGEIVHRENLNVARVAKAVCRMLTPLAEASNCTIRAEVCDSSVVYANYDEIYQVFMNLVENAIKYSGKDQEIRVFVYNRDGWSHFIVDDDGEGIPEAELMKIFDRFYRVDKARARATGGTGLGLSIVASAVSKNNGTVKAMNRQGGGARFIVKLPLAPEESDLWPEEPDLW